MNPSVKQILKAVTDEEGGKRNRVENHTEQHCRRICANNSEDLQGKSFVQIPFGHGY